MNPASYDLSAYLVAQGYGALATADANGWSIWTMRMPDTPIRAIVVREEPSLGPVQDTSGNMDPFETCLLRFIVRAETDIIAYRRAKTIRDGLLVLRDYWVTEVGQFPVKYPSTVSQTDIHSWALDVAEGMFAQSFLMAIYRQENTAA